MRSSVSRISGLTEFYSCCEAAHLVSIQAEKDTPPYSTSVRLLFRRPDHLALVELVETSALDELRLLSGRRSLGFDTSGKKHSAWVKESASPAAHQPAFALLSNTTGTLPDLNICRAKENGLRGYADCLMAHPFGCNYAVSFGGGFLCCHPHREEIIENTINTSQNDRERNSG